MNKAKLVFEHRGKRQDTPEAQEKRQKFKSWLMREHHKPTKIRKVKAKYAKGDNLYYDESTVMTCELIYVQDGESFKSKWDIPQFLNLNHNTRKKLPTELDFDCDLEDKEQAHSVVHEVILALMRNNIHFAVFHAQGQRSPWIRIYDMEELAELEPFQRELAEKEFWKKVAPLFWKYCDKAVWTAEHELQLEFAPHWKYGTIFDLVFEHIPTKKDLQGEKNATLGCFNC